MITAIQVWARKYFQVDVVSYPGNDAFGEVFRPGCQNQDLTTPCTQWGIKHHLLHTSGAVLCVLWYSNVCVDYPLWGIGGQLIAWISKFSSILLYLKTSIVPAQ